MNRMWLAVGTFLAVCIAIRVALNTEQQKNDVTPFVECTGGNLAVTEARLEGVLGRIPVRIENLCAPKTNSAVT